jgi:hypothetical protein
MSDRSGRAPSQWRRLARLGGGFGVLVAGLVVLASGSANVAVRGTQALGITAGAAQEIGYAIGATIPLVVLVGLATTVETEDRYRRVAFAGIGVAVSGLAVGLGTAAGFGDTTVIGLYGLGLVGAVGSLFLGGLDSVRSDRTPSAGPITGYERNPGAGRSRHGDGSLPADGGDEDDDMEFLLDDEE